MADLRDALQDNAPGLTFQDKNNIRTLQSRLMQNIQFMGVRYEVIYLALMNVLGRVIADLPDAERQRLIGHSQASLPMYVEAYRVKEKRIEP